MHPPSATCRALARLHPRLRIAWHGRERRNEDELNAGSFAIVQLYHISDVGNDPDNPRTYFQPWEDGFGPVFSKEGRVERDWDPLFYKPIYVARLEDFHIDQREVFTGEIVTTVQLWLERSKRESRIALRKAMAHELHRKAEDMGQAMTDDLWRRANREWADGGAVVADEFCRGDLKKLEKRRERNSQFLLDYYKVPGM